MCPYDSNGVWSNVASYHVNTGDTLTTASQNPVWEDAALNGFSAVLVKDGRAPMTGNLNMGTTNKITNLANGTAAADAVNKGQLDAFTAGISTRGMLWGLTLSNNGADATNDIDIAVGSAADETASPWFVMNLTSTLTKRLDAAWAVGSGQGGLDTGAIANTSYHIWLIQRSDTGVVDALFSTSATSPTMPANYDRKRRIGSILRGAGAILAFRQVGDRFMWGTSIQDVNVSVASASALQGFTAPLGISRRLILALRLQSNGSTNTAIQMGDAAAGSANTSVLENLVEAGGTEVSYATIEQFFSNTSSQLYMAVVGNAPATFTIRTMGWVDTRGKE